MSDGNPISVGPDWDIHVDDFTITVGPAGLRDFTRDTLQAPCWVALGANLIWVGGNVFIHPHLNSDGGSPAVRSWSVPDDGHDIGLREKLPEMLGL